MALTTLLCESLAAILASRSNRLMNSLFWARVSSRILMATTRSTLICLALKTTPIEPLPSFVDDLVAGDLELAIGLAGLLQQPHHLAAGQDLGLDHDLQQALGVSSLAASFACVRLASLDLGGGGQAAAEDRLLELIHRGPRALGSLPDVLLSTGVAMKPSPWIWGAIHRSKRELTVLLERTGRRARVRLDVPIQTADAGECRTIKIAGFGA